MGWGRQYLVNRVNEKEQKLRAVNGSENLISIWEELKKKVFNMTHSSIDIRPL